MIQTIVNRLSVQALFIMKLKHYLLPNLFFFLFLFLFCSNPTLSTQDREFQQAKAKWAAASTGNYHFSFIYECHCPPTHIGPFNIYVKNDTIDSLFNTYDNSIAPSASFHEYRTIDQLFSWIDTQLHSDHAIDTIYYDPTAGFPRYAFFDYEPVGTDGGTGFGIDSVIFDD